MRFVVLVSALCRAAALIDDMRSGSSDWDAVDAMIESFAFLPDVSFSAGDASGRKHTYEKGAMLMHTQTLMASSSKFPAAVAIAGAVSRGYLSFETKACEVFEWWVSEPSDVRSRVTLQHLLTFTSGLVSSEDVGGCGVPCLGTENGTDYEPEACAREIYAQGPWVARPGALWSYHSLHLQLAGAMAAKAAGLSVQELLSEFLLEPLEMGATSWIGVKDGATLVPNPRNPHLAVYMVSTGDDYDTFLTAVLGYSILDKTLVDELERDAYVTYPGLNVSTAKDSELLFYGHYSMCIYFECVNTVWTRECAAAGVHADPGAFGYWPVIDRTKNYYSQLVIYRPISLPQWAIEQYNVSASILAALPAHCVAPLRFALQNPLELALGLEHPAPPYVPQPDPLAVLCDLAQATERPRSYESL